MKKNNYSPPKNFLSTGFADMSCSSDISSYILCIIPTVSNKPVPPPNAQVKSAQNAIIPT